MKKFTVLREEEEQSQCFVPYTFRFHKVMYYSKYKFETDYTQGTD